MHSGSFQSVRRLLLAWTVAIGSAAPGALHAQDNAAEANRPVGAARGEVAAPAPLGLDRLLAEGRLDEIYDVYWGVTYRTERSIGSAVAEGDAAFVEWLRRNASGILRSDRTPPPLYIELIRVAPETPIADRMTWLALWRLRMFYDVGRCPDSRGAPYVGYFEASVSDVSRAFDLGAEGAIEAIDRALALDAASPYHGTGEWICLGSDTGRVPVESLQRPSAEWPALYERVRAAMRDYRVTLRARR